MNIIGSCDICQKNIFGTTGENKNYCEEHCKLKNEFETIKIIKRKKPVFKMNASPISGIEEFCSLTGLPPPDIKKYEQLSIELNTYHKKLVPINRLVLEQLMIELNIPITQKELNPQIDIVPLIPINPKNEVNIQLEIEPKLEMKPLQQPTLQLQQPVPLKPLLQLQETLQPLLQLQPTLQLQQPQQSLLQNPLKPLLPQQPLQQLTLQTPLKPLLPQQPLQQPTLQTQLKPLLPQQPLQQQPILQPLLPQQATLQSKLDENTIAKQLVNFLSSNQQKSNNKPPIYLFVPGLPEEKVVDTQNILPVTPPKFQTSPTTFKILSPIKSPKAISPMMSPKAISPMRLPNIKEDITECCVCGDETKDILDCNHYLCINCSKNLEDDNCPLCRKELKGKHITEELKEIIYLKNAIKNIENSEIADIRAEMQNYIQNDLKINLPNNWINQWYSLDLEQLQNLFETIKITKKLQNYNDFMGIPNNQ